jgi:hypothetical protein
MLAMHSAMGGALTADALTGVSPNFRNMSADGMAITALPGLYQRLIRVAPRPGDEGLLRCEVHHHGQEIVTMLFLRPVAVVRSVTGPGSISMKALALGSTFMAGC